MQPGGNNLLVIHQDFLEKIPVFLVKRGFTPLYGSLNYFVKNWQYRLTWPGTGQRPPKQPFGVGA